MKTKYTLRDEHGELDYLYAVYLILRTSPYRLGMALYEHRLGTGHGYDYTIEEAREALAAYWRRKKGNS